MEIKKVLIVGAGTMGGGIAQLCSQKGIEAVVTDMNLELANKAIARIDKGLSRQKAYEIVQRNAMKAWKGNRKFLTLLKGDAGVKETLPPAELEAVFDYQHYLQHIDEIFRRLGLTKSQWQADISETMNLTP